MMLFQSTEGLSRIPRLPSIAGVVFALACLALLTLLAGCVPRAKAYPGPVLANDQIGVVVPARVAGFTNKYVAILQINGSDQIEEWRGGGSNKVELLPGDYKLRVEFKQMTQATTIPIVDVFAMIGDAAAAAEHEEKIIAFPVRAGGVYLVHYKENGHVYSVSVAPPGSLPDAVPLYPPPSAVECMEVPDRNADLWCALEPIVE